MAYDVNKVQYKTLIQNLKFDKDKGIQWIEFILKNHKNETMEEEIVEINNKQKRGSRKDEQHKKLAYQIHVS